MMHLLHSPEGGQLAFLICLVIGHLLGRLHHRRRQRKKTDLKFLTPNRHLDGFSQANKEDSL